MPSDESRALETGGLTELARAFHNLQEGEHLGPCGGNQSYFGKSTVVTVHSACRVLGANATGREQIEHALSSVIGLVVSGLDLAGGLEEFIGPVVE